MADISVGYYVHHHGTGHMRRALQVIPFIPYPVVLFSSAEQPAHVPPNCTYVQLEDDSVPGYVQAPDSLFMYTPQSPRVRGRFQAISNAIEAHNITSMYVDVSMEVALFCKLLGLRVGHNVMQGIRDDAAHDHLYTMLDYYISDSTTLLDSTSRRHTVVRPHFIGGIARYGKRQPRALGPVQSVTITYSPASQQLDVTNIAASAAAFPDIDWHLIGPVQAGPELPNVICHGVVDDPLDIYTQADIVVGAGGHNTIMEMASLGKRFVCIPETRPYDEQVTAAKALAAHNMALHYDAWPTITQWQQVFQTLPSLNIDDFQSIVNDKAAQCAAAIIAEHAR